MGHSTWADVVPFVAHDIFSVDHNREPHTEFLQMMVEPYGYSNGDFCDDPKPVIQNGWAWNESMTNIGKKNRISCCGVWTKNNHHVWIINESEYENVGEYRMSVISDNLESIEAFLRDFNLDNPIEENDTVTQSG